jgi:hypothetical protein
MIGVSSIVTSPSGTIDDDLDAMDLFVDDVLKQDNTVNVD